MSCAPGGANGRRQPQSREKPPVWACIQSVHIATRYALFSTTDRWDTRLGGLEDRMSTSSTKFTRCVIRALSRAAKAECGLRSASDCGFGADNMRKTPRQKLDAALEFVLFLFTCQFRP